MNFIETHSFKSKLYAKSENDSVTCLACRRKCKISEGGSGFCKVRFNKKGFLMVPYGYVSALNIDPIEKKPVYHFMPGSDTLSFGMFGCNFRCDYCQNYEISQIFLDENIKNISFRNISLDEIVSIAEENDIKIIVSTYNEPTVSIEWAAEIFKKAKNKIKSAKTGFVSNGYLSDESLDYIFGCVDFIRADLKSFNYEKFKKLTKADLKDLIVSIEKIYKKGFHLEIVTLIVEGFNDTKQELKEIAFFIKSLSSDIPWHITRAHPDYKMSDINPPAVPKMEDLIAYARSLGLNYVYGGNYDTSYKDTLCPKCGKKIFEREYMRLKYYGIKNGLCPKCGQKIYGVY